MSHHDNDEKHVQLKCTKNLLHLFDYVEEDNVPPVCEHAASDDDDLNVLESDVSYQK